MHGIRAWFIARPHREALAVASFFVAVALAATWPIPTAPAELSVSGPANSDIFLNQYLIFWGAHALTSDPGNLYHTNMFHPSPYTFAYADMLLTDSLLTLPVFLTTNNPGLAYNVLLWLSIVIGSAGMYALCRELAIRRAGALVAAMLFVLNPAHFVRYRQPQFFNDGFLPWFLMALLVWLASCGVRGPRRTTTTRRSVGYAAIAALLFCLHAQTGSHNAIFGLLLGAGIVVFYAGGWILRGSQRADLRRFLAGTAVMAAVGVLVLAPLFYPYFIVSQFLEGERVDAEALRGGSAEAIDLLSADSRFYRWLDTAAGWPSAYFDAGDGPRRHAFPGAILLLMAATALLPSRGPTSTARWVGAGLLDLVLAGTFAGALANVLVGWRRLSTLTPALPSVWVLALIAVAAAAIRTRWLADVPTLWRGLLRQLGEHRDRRFWALAIALLGLAALGPAAGLYEIVRFIPGANLIRVPSRFLLPATMGLSVLAAWGVARILRRGQAGAITLAVLMGLFVVESTFAPIPLVAHPYPPDPVALWMGEEAGDFAIFEVPATGIRSDPTRQMFQSVHHWKKLLVGYSGAFPPGYHERIRRLDEQFPDDAALDELASLDVHYVVVREDRIDPGVRQAIADEPRLQLVQEFETGTVWALDAPDR